MIRSKATTPLSNQVAVYMVIITLSLIFLNIAQHILVPLAYAGLFSLLLYPICRFLEDNGFPRIIAIIISFLIASLIMTGLTIILWAQVASFVDSLPDLESKTRAFWRDIQYYVFRNFKVDIGSYSQLTKTSVVKVMDNGALLLSSTINTFSGLFNFIGLVPVYMFLMLLYRSAFRDFFMFVTPVERHRTVKRVIYEIQKVVQNYIIGLVSVMAIVAVLNVIVLYIVGSPFPVFFGVLAATLMIIPYIGLIVGSLLPAVYALLMTSSYHMPVAILAGLFVVQFLEGNFITPYVTGSKVKVNALAAIIGLVVWGSLWGTAGLVISMPFVAILKVILDSIQTTKHLGFLLGTEIYESRIIMPNLRRRNYPVSPRHEGDATPESMRGPEPEEAEEGEEKAEEA